MMPICCSTNELLKLDIGEIYEEKDCIGYGW